MFANFLKRSLPVTMIVFGIAIFALQACTSNTVSWRHDTIAQEEWGVDGAQCKWEAQQKAEDDYFKNTSTAQQGNLDDTQSIDTMFASSSVNTRAIQLYNTCMANLGYVEVE